MKVLTEIDLPLATHPLGLNQFSLPLGIVGFPEYTQANLMSHHEQFPFFWMKLQGPLGSANFVVIEPKGIIPGYEPELFDSDAVALGLSHASEAMVLTILTMRPGTPVEATVNLIGPIVVNRRTQIGRQLVIANYSRYRARQPLAATTPAAASA
jgi:flagellar assembly factor FliW